MRPIIKKCLFMFMAFTCLDFLRDKVDLYLQLLIKNVHIHLF